MKTLKLELQGKVYEVLVDDADYVRVIKHEWKLSQHGDKPRVAMVGSNGRRIQPHIYLHHFIVRLPFNRKIRLKDGDPLNCQRSNIRLPIDKSLTDDEWLGLRVGGVSGRRDPKRAAVEPSGNGLVPVEISEWVKNDLMAAPREKFDVIVASIVALRDAHDLIG